VTFRVVVRRSAASEVSEAYHWYESQQAGLGSAFLGEIEATLQRIEAGPRRYTFAPGDARRALVRRFPFSVYFRIRNDEIRIIAVIHQHRDPRVVRAKLRR
jgi:plasmid stabilization system protein ParE